MNGICASIVNIVNRSKINRDFTAKPFSVKLVNQRIDLFTIGLIDINANGNLKNIGT